MTCSTRPPQRAVEAAQLLCCAVRCAQAAHSPRGRLEASHPRLLPRRRCRWWTPPPARVVGPAARPPRQAAVRVQAQVPVRVQEPRQRQVRPKQGRVMNRARQLYPQPKRTPRRWKRYRQRQRRLQLQNKLPKRHLPRQRHTPNQCRLRPALLLTLTGAMRLSSDTTPPTARMCCCLRKVWWKLWTSRMDGKCSSTLQVPTQRRALM